MDERKCWWRKSWLVMKVRETVILIGVLNPLICAENFKIQRHTDTRSSPTETLSDSNPPTHPFLTL